MITIEVKDPAGKVIESQTFLSYVLATEWFERARQLYEQGISIRFEAPAVCR